jgi:large subunit ribosomal protein L29
MKKSELRNLSAEELIQRERDLKKELFKLNYQRKMGRVEKPHIFKQTRKEIARIKTFLAQRNSSKTKVEVTEDARV